MSELFGKVIAKAIGIFFIWLIASNSYFGIVNEKGEKVTDLNEVLIKHGVIEDVKETEINENE